MSSENSDLDNVYGRGISIPSGADLNNYIDPGNYYSFDTANTATLLHVPEGVTTGFRMEVKTTTANNWVKQIIYPNAKLQRTHYRQSEGATDKWVDWHRSLSNADIQIYNLITPVTNGSNIVTGTVPGLKVGKACLATVSTTTSNYILCAAATAENTIQVRFANSFSGSGNIRISVVFEP